MSRVFIRPLTMSIREIVSIVMIGSHESMSGFKRYNKNAFVSTTVEKFK
jgi:hypothetical protein